MALNLDCVGTILSVHHVLYKMASKNGHGTLLTGSVSQARWIQNGFQKWIRHASHRFGEPRTMPQWPAVCPRKWHTHVEKVKWDYLFFYFFIFHVLKFYMSPWDFDGRICEGREGKPKEAVVTCNTSCQHFHHGGSCEELYRTRLRVGEWGFNPNYWYEEKKRGTSHWQQTLTIWWYNYDE